MGEQFKDFLLFFYRIYLIFLGFFPSALPKGMKEFDRFADQIFFIYDLPDNESYRHAIATMVMHLGPTVAYKSKFYFALSIKKAMSNQIAYQKIRELKDKAEEIAEQKEQNPQTSEDTDKTLKESNQEFLKNGGIQA